MEAFGKWDRSISNGRMGGVCVAVSCNVAEERAWLHVCNGLVWILWKIPTHWQVLILAGKSEVNRILYRKYSGIKSSFFYFQLSWVHTTLKLTTVIFIE